MTVKVTVPANSIPTTRTEATGPKTLGEMAAEKKAAEKKAAEKKAAEKEQEVQDLARLAEKRISEERGKGVMPKRPTKEQAREVARQALERKKEQGGAVAPKEPVKRAYVEMPEKLERWADPETGLPWEKLKAQMQMEGATKKFTIPVEVAGMKGDWVIRIEGITEHGGKEMYWYTVSGWPAEIQYLPGETTGVISLEKGQSLRSELARNIQRSFAESGSKKKE